MSRYRDPQPQVAQNYSYLFNLSTNIYKSWCLDTYSIPNNRDFGQLKKKQIKNENNRDQHDEGWYLVMPWLISDDTSHFNTLCTGFHYETYIGISPYHTLAVDSA